MAMVSPSTTDVKVVDSIAESAGVVTGAGAGVVLAAGAEIAGVG